MGNFRGNDRNKNMVSEKKNFSDKLNSRLDTAEEIISELEYRVTKTI